MLAIAILFGAALVFARKIGRIPATAMLLAYGAYVFAQFAPGAI